MTELEIKLEHKVEVLRKRVTLLLDILTATAQEFERIHAVHGAMISQRYLTQLQETLAELNKLTGTDNLNIVAIPGGSN